MYLKIEEDKWGLVGSMNLIKKITDETVKLFSDDSRILAVFLLGSAVKGHLRLDSDIDLAVMAEPGIKIGTLELLKYANILSCQLIRTVDLGEISSANLVYAREALLTGVPVFQRDSEKVNLYRANLLGMYIQFNEDRQEVIDAYRAG